MSDPLPISSPEGVFASWGFVQWALGGAATVFLAMVGFVARVSWKVGGFEKSYASLEAAVAADRAERVSAVAAICADAEKRGERYDGKLADLEANSRTVERAVAALPDAIMARIEAMFRDSFRDMTRRIDDALDRGRRPQS